MFRTKCGLCGTGDLSTFLDLGLTPLADRFPLTKDEPETYYRLRAGMCERCKLVQLQDIVPGEELYGTDYAFYTGASRSHNSYWFRYARHVEEAFAPKSLLEIACNDGSFINQMSTEVRCVGIDPATGPLAEVADGVVTINQAFTAATAQDIRDGHGTFDTVVANNVLAHVEDMQDFVAGLNLVTHRDSVISIEVQYLADLVTGNQFDHFYHEHRSFFSLRTLQRLFIGNGFTVFDVQRTPAQGGSIRVFISKGSNRYPVTDAVREMCGNEEWLDQWFTMEGMQGRVDHIASSLQDMVNDVHEFPDVVAGYGATAKSCTLLNYAGIGTEHLDWVVDTTPWKQGRYTPGTKIPVVAPKNEPIKPDAYLLLAWNYAFAILRQEQMFISQGGRFILPLPKPVIL